MTFSIIMIIIIIIIIALFQEDNIFGTDAILTYGPQFSNVIYKELMCQEAQVLFHFLLLFFTCY